MFIVRLPLGEIEINGQDELKRTPLIIAAERGSTGVVKVLLQAKAKVGEVDILGRTALHWAAWQGCDEIVRLLLDTGAQVDKRDTEEGHTPIELAVSKGYQGVSDLLRRAGEPKAEKSRVALG